MTWTPISQAALHDIVAQDLAKCSDEIRACYGRVAVPPGKWTQCSHGEEGEGFWKRRNLRVLRDLRALVMIDKLWP